MIDPLALKVAARFKAARQIVVDEEAWLLADGAQEAMVALEELQDGTQDLARLYADIPWKRKRLHLVQRDTTDALRSVKEIIDELTSLSGN